MTSHPEPVDAADDSLDSHGDDPEAVLVVGERSEDAHGRTCRALAADEDYRFRALTSDTDPCADTTDWYGSGVFEKMAPAQLGIALDDAIANLATVGDTPDCHVCLDGVPTSLDEADERALFRFLHALTARITDDGGRCHVHLADDVTARTVAPLFDRVVAVDGT